MGLVRLPQNVDEFCSPCFLGIFQDLKHWSIFLLMDNKFQGFSIDANYIRNNYFLLSQIALLIA